jgi:hypothetical protein
MGLFERAQVSPHLSRDKIQSSSCIGSFDTVPPPLNARSKPMMIVRMQVIARVLNVTLRAEIANFTRVANAMPMIRRMQNVVMVGRASARVQQSHRVKR